MPDAVEMLKGADGKEADPEHGCKHNHCLQLSKCFPVHAWLNIIHLHSSTADFLDVILYEGFPILFPPCQTETLFNGPLV